MCNVWIFYFNVSAALYSTSIPCPVKSPRKQHDQAMVKDPNKLHYLFTVA